MAAEELLNELYKQYQNLAELDEICTAKQNSLIKKDIVEFNELIKNEEKLLLKIHSSEKKRIEAVIQIIDQFELDGNKFRLVELVEHLGNRIEKKEKEKLLKLEKAIRELISSIRTINNQNDFLIQHSRQFITETINALVKTSDQKIIDRKG